MKAAVLAPDAVLLPTDFDTYRQYSRRFKAAVAEVAPVIEDRGIDEIYIDLTDVAGASDKTDEDIYSGVRLIARDIKSRVTAATGVDLLHGHHAQQDPLQTLLRSRQAGRSHHPHRLRDSRSDLAYDRRLLPGNL
jgi:nucleotidyltransferase/DNA polymerase involved in DNA repair